MRNYGLTVVLVLMFAFSLAGQCYFGFKSYNGERVADRRPELASISTYLRTGHFVSAVAENMESEFLQMSLFVLLTAFLYQKGSAESKKPPDERTAEDRRQQQHEREYDARQLRRWGWRWRLYRNSLSLCLATLFVFFFFLHAYGSLYKVNDQRALLGQTALTYPQIFFKPDFWFESFQNWQSEFFSIAAMGLLSIGLRQKDSPQSKRLSDPYWKTGGS